MNFKVLIILIILLDYLYRCFLRKLQKSYRHQPLPHVVEHLYQEDEYQTFLHYQEDKDRLSFIEKSLSTLLSIILILSDIYPFIITWLPSSPYLSSLGFLILTSLITLPLDILFAYLFQFKIEARYGFNHMTLKTFASDQIKDILTSSLLMAILLGIGFMSYHYLSTWAILLLAICIIIFVIACQFLTLPLMKLYHHFTEMEDTPLRSRLQQLAKDYQFEAKKIYIMDASKRTSHANAFCTGLGKMKSISLDDNLISYMNEDEIVAVFAHELAHAYYRDTWKMLILNLLSFSIYGACFYLLTRCPSLWLDFNIPTCHIGFIFTILMLIIDPIMHLMHFFTYFVSRKAEYRADAFALAHGHGEALISALCKLSKESLVQLNPHPLVILLTYSHPTLYQRIEAIHSKGKTS